MRIGLLLFAVILTLSFDICVRLIPYGLTSPLTGSKSQTPAPAYSTESMPNTATSATSITKVDFGTQVKPIFESGCRPCHFNGGTMYQRLPFDRPETIRTLGTRVFTRIKNENERRIIREFLTQD